MTRPDARTFEQVVAERLRAMANDPRIETAGGLEAALRLLAKWRSSLIDRTILSQNGPVVQAGPFRGMTFLKESTEAGLAPKLLGCYESELSDVIEKIVARGYRHIIDIGCADGYYAVGLALRLPNASVYAFDTNERAQANCKALAVLNGVADRVTCPGALRSGILKPTRSQTRSASSILRAPRTDCYSPMSRPPSNTSTSSLSVMMSSDKASLNKSSDASPSPTSSNE